MNLRVGEMQGLEPVLASSISVPSDEFAAGGAATLARAD